MLSVYSNCLAQKTLVYLSFSLGKQKFVKDKLIGWMHFLIQKTLKIEFVRFFIYNYVIDLFKAWLLFFTLRLYVQNYIKKAK